MSDIISAWICEEVMDYGLYDVLWSEPTGTDKENFDYTPYVSFDDHEKVVKELQGYNEILQEAISGLELEINSLKETIFELEMGEDL